MQRKSVVVFDPRDTPYLYRDMGFKKHLKRNTANQIEMHVAYWSCLIWRISDRL